MAYSFSPDDFADTTPPPPKKTKVSSKPTKAKASSLSIEPILDLNNSSLRSKKSRFEFLYIICKIFFYIDVYTFLMIH